ncbi:MAG TPA: antibiotic biosynthesis monooxygenase [Acidobacteriota bacterium]|jgi:heme-degrading monooxygenase HmoA
MTQHGTGKQQSRIFYHRFIKTVNACAILCAMLAAAAAQEGGKESRQAMANYPDLIGGLKAVKGCLGVEAARTQSGKNVIFAWFEDKEAVLRWYYSDMHKAAVQKFFPGFVLPEPMKDIPNDSGPILAIASITFTEKSKLNETSMPISQIAIELYQPMTGGLFLGSRFAPESVKVAKMKDFTPKK